jgi:endoglucanase
MAFALLLAAVLMFPVNDARSAIRVNELGYATHGRHVAVLCSLDPRTFSHFTVVDAHRIVAFRGRAEPKGPYGPCVSTFDLDFSRLTRPGSYHIEAQGVRSPLFRIVRDPYRGVPDTLLSFMRDERSGYNPLFHAYVHTHDGIVVDGPYKGRYFDVSGGWADAADELQYVTTSAMATFVLLAAYRDFPNAFRANDVLDEAHHGLDWLLQMYPKPNLMFNQLGDDRDHLTFHVFTDDETNYGWGPGGARPIYPCTGRPQGLFRYKNHSTGAASTAGKLAAAFALGAQIYRRTAPRYAHLLAIKAREAYAYGQIHPGVCQTAPATAPYYYEEANYSADMEMGAAELYALTRDRRYLREALAYAAMEPVNPWMGADTSEHYQWYPFLNWGHYELWRVGDAAVRRTMDRYYRIGLERVAARACNAFSIGIPFVWVSNDLAIAYATQAYLYRRMTGDTRFLPYEDGTRDWLFGENLWGTSFAIGVPPGGPYPRHPQSIEHHLLHIVMRGGVVDGPVYRSVFERLKGIRLSRPDVYAQYNTGFAVYHDDFWDYSTNEPVMSTTADLVYLAAAMEARP